MNSYMVVATFKGGAVGTFDGGITWVPAGNQFNLPSFSNINKASSVSNRIFVSTEKNSVYSNALSEILDRISTAHLANREFVIKIFNWKSMQFDTEETIVPTDYLIIEGVGAAQQIVRDSGATTYWLDIEPEIGLQRVLERDGAHIEAQMRRWQVEQDKHFARDETRENCEFKLTS